MKGVYALYEDGDAAERAVRRLRAAGIADREITIISAEPLEDYEFSEMNRQTGMWYIASAGGLAGLLGATWLTRMTELAWPISTGNMAIVSWWPNLIVMFEMMMLGAILATVAALMVTGGLLRRRPAFYDPEVSDGKILVGVETPAEGVRTDIEQALCIAPDVQLKVV